MDSTSLETTKAPAAARRASPAGPARWARRNALQIGITVVAVLIWVLFLIGSPRTFLSGNIYQAFMSTTPFFAIVALPLTMVIIAAEIDLSFPSIMSFGMVIFSLVMVATGSLVLALIACLAAGLLAGLLNGVIVVKFGIPSLVATIGTQFFWRGAVNVITGGRGTSLTVAKGTWLYNILVGRLWGVLPAQMIWTIVVAAVVWFFLNRHKFGAHVYLTGDNIDSARLMGVNVDRVKMITFAIVGLASAFAGLVVSLELVYYWPTLGEGNLMNTLAAVFLGGTSVFGGTGTIYGTFVASFIIGAINAGIVAAGISGFWTQLIYGLIIVVSVSLQAMLARRLA